jgi:hypothetical protein
METKLITFRDGVVLYTVVGNVHKLGSSVPIQVINNEQMELIKLMLSDITEPVFSCSNEEFYSRLTVSMFEGYLRLKSNEFKLIDYEESINVLDSGRHA